MRELQRLERLEQIALNQTLIIEQLTQLVKALAPVTVVRDTLDACAEQMLGLVFDQGVPVEALELTADWRRSLAGAREVMLTS